MLFFRFSSFLLVFFAIFTTTLVAASDLLAFYVSKQALGSYSKSVKGPSAFQNQALFGEIHRLEDAKQGLRQS